MSSIAKNPISSDPSSSAKEPMASDLHTYHEGICNSDSIIMSAVVGDVMHLHQALMQPDREPKEKALESCPHRSSA